MKTHLFYTLFLLSLYYAILLPLSVRAEDVVDFSAFDVRINEVFPNPAGSDSDGEFIEIYNPTDNDGDIDLTDWKIVTRSASGTQKEQILSATIGAKDFVVLEKANGDFTFSLTNTFFTLELVAPDATILSTLTYESAPEEKSWNYDVEQWYWAAPTLNDDNNLEIIEEEEGIEDDANTALQDSYLGLLLSEILPNPRDDEDREYIEIFNPHKTALPLAGWSVRDSSKSGVFTFSDDIIAPQSYFIVERSDFGFALNNTGVETVSLFDPRKELRASVTYDGAREGYAYAWDGDMWQWTPEQTPGKQNTFVAPPEVDIDMPKHVYRNVPALFSISIDGIDDTDFTVRWDFGDGGTQSTKKEVLHTYTKKGDEDGSVTIKIDGASIVEEFSVDVEKYPKRTLAITHILPNPVGADTGTEYITIQNTSEKKVKLGEWFIAIGSHPTALLQKRITDTITLAPGEIFTLTREHALFTLPNRTGVIEMRRPDGSEASHVAYTIPTGMKEGAIYENVNDTWQWIAPTPEESVINTLDGSTTLDASYIIAQALRNEQVSINPTSQNVDDVDQSSILYDDIVKNQNKESFLQRKVLKTKGLFKKIVDFAISTYRSIAS